MKMTGEMVKCDRQSSASADVVWAHIKDFTRPWHPDINWMKAETGANGACLRRFAVNHDDTEYLERQTYISHSDRVMGYAALEGIDGLKSYNAQISIGDLPPGASMVWRAKIKADGPRAAQIAAGTAAVFDAGLACLADLPDAEIAPYLPPEDTPEIIQSRQFGKAPKLAISVAPAGLERADVICIFLHGIGGHRGNWDAQLGEIGGQIPCISLDLRGYGDSALGKKPSDIAAYCQDILAIAEKFDAQKIVLCGLSYGAWIATSFAMRHGEKLAGLVLAGGCTGMSEAAIEERDNFRKSREVPLDAGQTPADFAPAVVDVIAGPNASKTTRKTLLTSMAMIPAATYRDALNCFTNPTETFDFSRISCPVLLMTGAHDKLAPATQIREVSLRMLDAQQEPDIQFEIIADAGHVCNLERPDVFNAHLRNFLKKVAPKGRKILLSGKEMRRRKKHQTILDAALTEFSRNGFSGASMQAIAERAGVSKPTLYQYFGQKDALLSAVLDKGKSELLAPFENTNNATLVEILWQFSWTYADFVLRPDMLSLARLIIGEAERMPDVAQDYQRKGPLKALAGIVAFLTQQKVAGALDFENAELAAQHLWSLILSAPREQHLHNHALNPDRAQLAMYISSGLRVFLKAYSTNVGTDLKALDHVIPPPQNQTETRNHD